MLAHIRNGEIIRKYQDGKGRVALENGDTVSPPVAGYVNGTDRIVPVVQETVDNSTTAVTKTTVTETVEADRVLRARTVEDVLLADRKVRLQQEARQAYSEAMRPISRDYPPEEREGWAEQVAAAQEVMTGGQNDLIDALRAPTGETALDMADNIIAKRAEYLIAYGQVTAARRGVDAKIAAATTLADLDAIDVRAAFGLTT